MSAAAWVIATDEKYLVSLVEAGAALGSPPTVLVVGSPELAQAAVDAGAGQVAWIEPAAGTPAEAYTAAAVSLVSQAGPRLLLSSSAAAARTLLGAAAAALGAAVVTAAIKVELGGDTLVVHCNRLGGSVVEAFESTGPVAAVCQGYDAPPPGTAGASPEPAQAGEPGAFGIVEEQPAPGGGGLTEAERVVGFGRGVKVRADMALIEELAQAMDAAVGCTMPVADDYKWMSQYIGRSGLSIAPKLYLAVGIQGSPQHTEGIRDAKVVAAINSDPEAPIFRRATYGIVADLYEVLPELLTALKN